VTVVEVHSVRARGNWYVKLPPGFDDLEDAVHARRVDAVEVDGVRVGAAVREVHPQQVVLGRADDRARDGAVVRPGVEEHPLGHLDLAVDRRELVLAYATGLCGSTGGGWRRSSSAFGPPGAGTSCPCIAAWVGASMAIPG
jgi:hypothetical protein